MTTITFTDTAVQTPFADAGFDEAQRQARRGVTANSPPLPDPHVRRQRW